MDKIIVLIIFYRDGEPTIPQVHYYHNDIAVSARFCYSLGGGFRSSLFWPQRRKWEYLRLPNGKESVRLVHIFLRVCTRAAPPDRAPDCNSRRLFACVFTTLRVESLAKGTCVSPPRCDTELKTDGTPGPAISKGARADREVDQCS